MTDTTRRHTLGLFAIAALAAAPLQAQTAPPAAISVREAHERAAAGRALLIDIRTPAEWRDTGLPANAIALDMTSPVFEARLAMLRAENPGKPIALICRTASRSRNLQRLLAGRGWTNLVDVRGGMLGDGQNKGWLDENLPLAR
jgi:rhodanese-related sulfurtransferase